MPELPEVEALAAGLTLRAGGRSIERVRLTSFSALKTVDPPVEALAGRTVGRVERRGKFVCLAADDRWLVVHLARGGWVRWYDALPGTVLKPGRSPIALRLALAGGAGFDVVEHGTEKHLALWVVHDPAEIAPVAALGVDPLDPAFTAEVLGRLLAVRPGTLKVLLTTQSVLAGVGNAYSDEALHRARLSPFRKGHALSADEVVRLHDALVGLLTEAVERAGGVGLADLKGDKRRSFAVHGRTGQACPVCGDTVRQVAYATRSLQYCPTCQTGGKMLADRRLSRLLK